MENEKIISLAEIVDFSEDDEPPSRCEGANSPFAFFCVLNQDLKQFPVCTINHVPRTDRSALHVWPYPIQCCSISVILNNSMLRHQHWTSVPQTKPFVPSCITP